MPNLKVQRVFKSTCITRADPVATLIARAAFGSLRTIRQLPKIGRALRKPARDRTVPENRSAPFRKIFQAVAPMRCLCNCFICIFGPTGGTFYSAYTSEERDYVIRIRSPGYFLRLAIFCRAVSLIWIVSHSPNNEIKERSSGS